MVNARDVGVAPDGALLTEIYWWAVYSYASYGAGQFEMRDNPVQGGNFADDSVPAETDPIAGYGGMGFFVPGKHAVFPAAGDPTGACCFPDGSCQVLTAVDCAAAGGVYQGDDVPCDPNPCPLPTGACCIGGGGEAVCQVLTEEDCLLSGGVYQGDGVPCVPDPCPAPTGACCLEDGSCQVLTADDCATLGGLYLGDDVPCDPNPCAQPTGACCFARWKLSGSDRG